MPRKALTIAAALAFASVGGPALTLSYAAWTVRADVARFADSHPGLRIGGVDVDVLGGGVTLHDVALNSGSLHVYAQALSLPGAGARFALVTPAFAEGPTAAPAGGVPTQAPGTASASNLTIISGSTTYTIKKIDLTGTSLSNADLLALLDPKGAGTLADRLQKLNAGSIAISDLRSEIKSGGSTIHATVSQIILANVAAGKIGTASAASSTVSAQGDKGGLDIRTGAIEAAGLDLALLERVVNIKRTDDAEPLKTLSERLVISDLSLTNADKKAAVTIATLAQKALKVRPLKVDLAAPQANPAVPDEGASRGRHNKDLLEDISGSVAVAAFSIDKMTVANTNEDGASQLAVARMDLDDYGDRKLSALRLQDFRFDGPNVRLGVGAVDLAGIALPDTGKSANADALTTDGLPSVAKGDVERIDVDAVTPKDDGSASHLQFKIAHVGSLSDQVAGQPPTQGAVTVDHLTFDVPPGDGPGARELLAMGYKTLDLSGALASAYDQKLQTLSVQKLLLSGAGMGSLTLGMDFGNVGKGILSSNPAVAKASAFAMLLKRLDVRVANAGLVDRILAWKAKQDGRSVAEERSSAIDLFSVAIPQGLGGGPGIKAIGSAVAAFIADPRTLHVSATSKDGLGAADVGLIGSPDELLNRLDIQAEANK